MNKKDLVKSVLRLKEDDLQFVKKKIAEGSENP